MSQDKSAQDLLLIRSQIRRLQERESALALELGMKPSTGARPGWPIRRVAPPDNPVRQELH